MTISTTCSVTLTNRSRESCSACNCKHGKSERGMAVLVQPGGTVKQRKGLGIHWWKQQATAEHIQFHLVKKT